MAAPEPAVFCSGATGYIGGAILRHFSANGVRTLGGVRQARVLAPGIASIVTGDLSEPGLKLPPVEVVIHAAGLGHRRGVRSSVWRRANVEAAVNLASAARRA